MTIATLEAHVADAEWRTALVDESRTYEIWPRLRRAGLITDYLGPTLALAAPTADTEVQP